VAVKIDDGWEHAHIRSGAKPRLKHSGLKCVHGDGAHNAFTDMISFNGNIFLAFRSAAEHNITANSKIVILKSSNDGASWGKVHEFKLPGGKQDPRDPHLVVFKGKLILYTAAWRADISPDITDMVGFAVSTTDGKTWTRPVECPGTKGYYIWRAATNPANGRVFLTGRRRKNFAKGSAEAPEHLIEAAVLTSEDGLSFEFFGCATTSYGDETAIMFEEDGTMLALVRGAGDGASYVARASPPYAAEQDWTRVKTPTPVGGPLLFKWGEDYMVAGRCYASGETTGVWSLSKTGQLTKLLGLPSGGDTSYPGFVPLNEKEGLMSYYSSHEGATKIYVAKITKG